MIVLRLGILFVLVGLQAEGSPTLAVESKAPEVVFRNAQVFDGEKLLPKGTVVVVDGGKIVAVGKDASEPPSARVIDASGKTLLPGLIDAHTHVLNSEMLRAALVFGVTTELDMFSSQTLLAEIRK